MPISASNELSQPFGSLNSWVSDSISPANGLLYLALVVHQSTQTKTLSGCGLNWVQVGSVVQGTLTGTLFRALKTSGVTSGAVTVSFGGASGNGKLLIDEIDGVAGGTDGAGSIVQVVSGTDSGSNISLSLSAFGSSDNAAYGAFGVNTSAAITGSGLGWTKLGSYFSSATGALTEIHPGQDLVVDASVGAFPSWVAFALEIRARVVHAIGQPTESDLAQAVKAQRRVPLGQAGPEVDIAQSIRPWGPRRWLVDRAIESDVAQPIVATLSGTPARKITKTLSPTAATKSTLHVAPEGPDTLTPNPFTEPCS